MKPVGEKFILNFNISLQRSLHILFENHILYEKVIKIIKIIIIIICLIYRGHQKLIQIYQNSSTIVFRFVGMKASSGLSRSTNDQLEDLFGTKGNIYVESL